MFKQYKEKSDCRLSICTGKLVISGLLSIIIFYSVISNIQHDIDTASLHDLALISRKSFAGADENFCHLPNLNPFDKSIMKYVKTAKLVDCTKNPKQIMKLLFQTDRNSTLIRSDDDDLEKRTCCYKYFQGKTSKPVYSKECYPIVEKYTRIPSLHEFIGIFCRNRVQVPRENSSLDESEEKLIDMLHFTPLKQKPEAKYKQHRKNNDSLTSKVNVVIFGIDAVSHLNFQRTMPLTRNYLMKILSSTFLNGYTKVGDNTFPNIAPVLMGLNVSEIQATCWRTKHDYFDSCPFIWKKYAEKGYLTAYAEDSVSIGIFNYLKKGWKIPPTDYFLNNFMTAYVNALGHLTRGNSKWCSGPRLNFSVLLDNMEKLAVQMSKTWNYFQFIWATSIFHDYLNAPRIVDKDLMKSLTFLNEGGYLNNTVLILMSDHGIRFGKIRETFQGKVEENMPFVYIVFPPWFKTKYARAVNNFLYNQNKLTTPFDLHELLIDLLNLNSISETEIQNRETNLLKSEIFPRGISLFLSIPNNRTCEHASIPDSHCVCHSMTPIPVDSEGVKDSTLAAIEELNRIVKQDRHCNQLILSSILAAHNVDLRGNRTDLITTKPVELVVLFTTTPGDAVFEAVMIKPNEMPWKVAGDISRVNEYGDQSRCVSDYNLKKYCYC